MPADMSLLAVGGGGEIYEASILGYDYYSVDYVQKGSEWVHGSRSPELPHSPASPFESPRYMHPWSAAHRYMYTCPSLIRLETMCQICT